MSKTVLPTGKPTVKPGRWRARLRWLHRWLGLGLGLLFALIGLSGSFLALQPELLRLQHPDWPSVVASNEALATALERITHSAVANEITAIDLPTERLPVWQAYTAQDRRHYFDAQRGEWLLTRDVRSDWLLWVRDLHTHLLAGVVGEQVLGVAGLCLLLLLGSGLYLWWPRWRSFGASLRWHRRPVVLRWLSWHRSSGAVLFAGLFVLSLTGVAMIYGAPVRASLRWMAGEGTELVVPAPLPRRNAELPWQAILRAAQAAMPEAELRRIALPRADNAWVVIRARQPEEWHPNGRSMLWIDPYTARVAKTHDATMQGWGSRLDEALYPIHGGFVGGAIWLGFVLALGIVPAFLLVTGVMLWWTKRRHRDVRNPDLSVHRPR